MHIVAAGGRKKALPDANKLIQQALSGPDANKRLIRDLARSIAKKCEMSPETIRSRIKVALAHKNGKKAKKRKHENNGKENKTKQKKKKKKNNNKKNNKNKTKQQYCQSAPARVSRNQAIKNKRRFHSESYIVMVIVAVLQQFENNELACCSDLCQLFNGSI